MTQLNLNMRISLKYWVDPSPKEEKAVSLEILETIIKMEEATISNRTQDLTEINSAEEVAKAEEVDLEERIDNF